MTGKHYKDLRERAGLTRLELAERLQIGERKVCLKLPTSDLHFIEAHNAEEVE